MTKASIRNIVVGLVAAVTVSLSVPQLSAQHRPTPCPQTITERTFGFLDFWHAGYRWPGKFRLRESFADGEGYYVPDTNVSYLISLNGKGIWENAGLIVNCQAEEWWDAFGLHVRIWYHVHRFLGKVRERCGDTAGGTGGGANPVIDEYGNPTYDPYQESSTNDPNFVDSSYYIDHGDYSFTPLYSEADFSSFDGYGSCESGSSGGSGGDGAGQTGSTGTCRTEHIVIEISYDNGATWIVWWEGEATVCE